MVDRATKLAIKEGNASQDACDYWDTVLFIASFGVLKVSFLKAEELKVDPLLTAFMTDRWDDNNFLCSFWGFGLVEFVCLDATSYPSSWS